MDRATLASDDALRSLLFVLLSAALVAWFMVAKNKKTVATWVGIGMTVLIFVDLWTVDKRYLNDKNFFPKKDIQATYQESVSDQEILKDKDNFRVLNLNNTFLETNTSYYHHSITIIRLVDIMLPS